VIDIKIVRDPGGTEERGEPQPITIDSRDVLNLETQVKGASFQTLSDPKFMRMAHIYYAAWLSARRTGVIQKDVSIEAFREVYVLDLSSEDQEPNPTPAGA